MRPPRGRGGGGGGRFGRGGGGGRFGGGFRDEGPPAEVVEVSAFLHSCEGDAVTKPTNEKVPYFNAPIYLQNKTQIGKVDEIFGPINESYFSVKMMEGIIPTSYKEGDKFFIDPMKLLPLSRFLPQPKGQSQGTPRGGGRGSFRGGRGGGGRGSFRGGRGPPRGGAWPSKGWPWWFQRARQILVTVVCLEQRTPSKPFMFMYPDVKASRIIETFM